MRFRLSRGQLAGLSLGLLWAGFAAWAVHGFPPGVDLPAHAAQLQTLADLLRGREEVAQHYRATFPIGYGAVTWLFAPLAMATDGTVAARVAVWLTLVLLPIGHAVLARELGRSGWVAAFSAPMAFGVSYWYGFLSTFFALPWTLFAWALFVRVSKSSRARARSVLVLAALCVLVMLSHLVVFGVLAVGIAALALARSDRRRALTLAAISLAPGFLLCGARIVLFAGRALGQTRQPTDYDLAGHLNWILKASDTDGRIALWSTVLTGLVLVGVMFWRRTAEKLPVFLFLAMVLLYLATPKSLSGAWLIYPRLAVFLALSALLLVDMRSLARPLRFLLIAFALTSLVATARRHVRFAHQIRGLDAVTATPPPPGVHGGLSLAGLTLPGSRIKFLEHLPQWWTARHGGVGTHFFADADHQPVRFVEGKALRGLTTPEAGLPVGHFSALLVYGEGELPSELAAFRETQRSGMWRRIERR